MQGARKKQESQHPVENGRLEIDLPDEPRKVLVQADMRDHQLDRDEQQGGGQSHDEETDRVRQENEAMVHPCERCRQHKQGCDEVESGEHADPDDSRNRRRAIAQGLAGVVASPAAGRRSPAAPPRCPLLREHAAQFTVPETASSRRSQ
jgi:hypothetical protein